MHCFCNCVIYNYALGIVCVHLPLSCHSFFHCQSVHSISKYDAGVSIHLLSEQWINPFWISPHRYFLFWKSPFFSFFLEYLCVFDQQCWTCQNSVWQKYCFYSSTFGRCNMYKTKQPRHKGMLGYWEPKLHCFVLQASQEVHWSPCFSGNGLVVSEAQGSSCWPGLQLLLEP